MKSESQTKTTTQDDDQTGARISQSAARARSVPRRKRPRTLEVRRRAAQGPIANPLLAKARAAVRDALADRKPWMWNLPRARKSAPVLEWDPFCVTSEARGEELGSLYEFRPPTLREVREELSEQILCDRKFLQCARRRAGEEEDLRQAVLAVALEKLPPLSARALRAYLRSGSYTRVAVTIALPLSRAQRVLWEAVDAVFDAMCGAGLAEPDELLDLMESGDYPFGDDDDSLCYGSPDEDSLYGDDDFAEDDDDWGDDEGIAEDGE